MSLTKKSKIMTAVGIVGLLMLFFSSAMFIKGSIDMEKFAQKKFTSIILAQEARATSIGLTANVRAFVNTGDPEYEKAYWDLEKIRKGELPRPSNAAIEPSKKISMEHLLSTSGFTEEENAVLYRSVELSRTLMAPEIRAINATKGIFINENGNYTIKSNPDKTLAQQLVFGRKYDAAATEIMAMSHKFVGMVIERINRESIEVKQTMASATIALCISLFVVAAIILTFMWMLIHKIIRPVRDCADFAMSVAAGNPLNDDDVADNDKKDRNEISALFDSVHQMAWYLKDRIEHAELKTKEALKARTEMELADVELWKLHAVAEAKNIFFASMSHEIRTPINAIMGLSDLLLRSSLTDTQVKHMRDIRSSSVALYKIINDILDTAKMELGKLELVKVDYNLMELVDNISSVTHVLAREKNIKFSCEKGCDLPQCLYGDPDRLRQVLLNLLSNAVKYTFEGEILLKISADNQDLTFQVCDSGIGITDEALPYLFDAYTRAEEKYKKGIAGTGLGLYITKILVEMMDGAIYVETKHGVGSVFKVVIPYSEGNCDAINIDIQTPSACIWDATVLVFDDNEINLNVAIALLEYLGVNCDTASSGKSSLAMVRNKKYDLIFMDHMMPDMDGIDTTLAIRDLGDWYAEVPIIAFTANAIHEAREMMLASGMNDFLSKPIDIAMLRVMLEKWLPPEKKKVSSS